MVSDRSSRADNWTDLCKISMHTFFLFEKKWKNHNMAETKHTNTVFGENKSLRSYTGHTKVGKNGKEKHSN